MMKYLFGTPVGRILLIQGDQVARTRNQQEFNNVASNNNQVAQTGDEFDAHSQSSTVNRAAERDQCEGG